MDILVICERYDHFKFFLQESIENVTKVINRQVAFVGDDRYICVRADEPERIRGMRPARVIHYSGEPSDRMMDGIRHFGLKLESCH